MDLNLANKKVLVTGGASGIGRSIAEHFLAEGAFVAFVDKNTATTSDFIQAAATPKLFGYVADLADDAQCEKAVEKCISFLDGVDILVNNAGVNDKVGFASTLKDFRHSVENNLVHYFHVTQKCLPYLKQSKGTVINIGSKVATTGQGGTSGYAASKGGIQALTREWAAELACAGVRVNAVIPAEVWTPLYESWVNTFEDPQSVLTKVADKIPLENRLTSVSEVSNVVLFLASSAASHMTGQFIYVDGGYVHLDRAL